MNKPLIDTLAERVERLERENRRWRWLSILALVSAIVVTFGGAHFADEPRIIEAERFILRDKNGKMRADLSETPEGFVGFVIFDQDERQWIGIGVYPNRIASFKMFSDTDKIRTTMHMQSDGSSGVNVFHDDELHLVMGMDRSGTTHLEMKDQDGKSIFEAPRQ